MRRRAVQRDGPDPIDRHVGRRLRARRTLLGMSQTSLAQALGLTFQQVQKYERGANRISASALFRLSRALDVPVAFFFEEMHEAYAAAKHALSRVNLRGHEERERGDRIPMTREMLELARAYHRIRDEKTRRQVSTFIKALGRNGASGDSDRNDT